MGINVISLKMEAAGSTETSASINQTTRRRILEHSSIEVLLLWTQFQLQTFCTVQWDGKMAVNGGYVRIWKGTVLTCFAWTDW
jgi:hypothetical protein